MTQEQVLELLRDELAQHTNRPKDTIMPGDNIINELGLDSLDYAAVVLGAEALMNGELDESAVNWSEVRTVQDLAEVLYLHVRR
jgi:acyl carrier protein